MVNYIQNVLLRGSWIEVMIAVIGAGAVASLSSCTLARLPVLLGLVSSKSNVAHRGFFLALAFSCGLIISYTSIGILLGLIAHSASKLMAISQYLYLVLGVFMIIAGLFFAGLMAWGHHGFNAYCQGAMKNVTTLPSAFVFGILFAFLEMPACPCCGAVLLLIVSLVAIKGSLMYSSFVFFSFALGQSLPVLLIGFSSGLLKKLLPKTQHWEAVISFGVGNILIVTGLFLIILS